MSITIKQKRSAISMNISPRTHDMGSRSALSACVYTALVLLISFVSRFMAVSHISRAGMYQTVQQTSFEIICALGGMDLLVGRGTYCDYPAEVQEIPSVQSGYETNIEQIIALEPQVLLMSTMAQTEEQIKALEDAGVHVVVSDAQDIEGTYAAIRMIGALLGKNEEAETVIDGMKTTFESLKGVCGDGEKTIYFEVSPLEYGLWTAGANTFMNEIAELLGLKNCFADVEGWAEISEEQVLERNPDYIMTISMYSGEGPTPEEEIASRAGWENVTAVKNGAILNLQNNELSRPAPRLAEGAQMLADFIAGVEANDKAA